MMIRSMTGYGRGESSRKGVKVWVEIHSVNRKQTELVFQVPREWSELESRLREMVQSRTSRGRVNITVGCQSAWNLEDPSLLFHLPTAKAYHRAAVRLIRELGLQGGVSLETILRCPGVLKGTGTEIPAEDAWTLILPALNLALNEWTRMKDKEGRHLSRDLKSRLMHLKKMIVTIRKEIPGMVENYRQQLLNRIQRAGLDLARDDERISKEVVFFADRSDVTEELTRLDSHLSQFSHKLNETQPAGRALEFLIQEIQREINTVGSKVSSLSISRTVMEFKSELERIREQIQNVE